MALQGMSLPSEPGVLTSVPGANENVEGKNQLQKTGLRCPRVNHCTCAPGYTHTRTCTGAHTRMHPCAHTHISTRTHTPVILKMRKDCQCVELLTCTQAEDHKWNS